MSPHFLSPNTLPHSIRWLLFAILTGLAGPLTAATIIQTWNSGFTSGGVVPDGNPVGWFDTRTLSGIPSATITDVNVSLTITGGLNGDLLVFLSHDSGISYLLNRTGLTAANPFGNIDPASDAGFDVIFDDSGSNGDSHVNFTGASILAGAFWEPDGRVSSLDIIRTSMLADFTGMDPNGSWTLFVADLSVDGAPATVTQWGLQITTMTAVPEPDLAVIQLFFLSSALLIRFRRKSKS